MACYRDSPAVPGFSMAIERLRFSTSYERSTESNLRSIRLLSKGSGPVGVTPLWPRSSRRHGSPGVQSAHQAVPHGRCQPVAIRDRQGGPGRVTAVRRQAIDARGGEPASCPSPAAGVEGGRELWRCSGGSAPA